MSVLSFEATFRNAFINIDYVIILIYSIYTIFICWYGKEKLVVLLNTIAYNNENTK